MFRLLDLKRITLVKSTLVELGTEKARIWPLTQELNPQSAFDYFYICKGNMPLTLEGVLQMALVQISIEGY